MQKIGEGFYREGQTIHCNYCRRALGAAKANPKTACLKIEREVGEANPWIALRNQGISKSFKLVEYVCPYCGSLLDVTLMLRSDNSDWNDYVVE